MDEDKVDFDAEVDRGPEAYDGDLGHWWVERGRGRSHGYACRNIARQVVRLSDSPPGLIVDYACGPGRLLYHLSKGFPEAHLVGIDASESMLERAAARMGRRRDNGGDVRFIRTVLPSLALEAMGADIATFAFPHIVSATDDFSGLDPEELAVAKALSLMEEPDPADRDDEPKHVVFSELATDRLIAKDLRSLLRPGGLCVRVEYAQAPRENQTDLMLRHSEFAEGSLDRAINGVEAPRLFEVLESRFFRSRVVEDVYHQTKDEADLSGGYWLTALRALDPANL
jgi:SAM-dependent methyltransferase